MKLNPTSDYGTWQRRLVFGQKAELLLVTLAKPQLSIIRQPITPLLLTFIRAWECFILTSIPRPHRLFQTVRLCGLEDSAFNNLCSYGIYLVYLNIHCAQGGHTETDT